MCKISNCRIQDLKAFRKDGEPSVHDDPSRELQQLLHIKSEVYFRPCLLEVGNQQFHQSHNTQFSKENVSGKQALQKDSFQLEWQLHVTHIENNLKYKKHNVIIKMDKKCKC